MRSSTSARGPPRPLSAGAASGSITTPVPRSRRSTRQRTTFSRQRRVTTSPSDFSFFTGPILAADRGGAWLIGVDQRGRSYLTRVLSGGGRRKYRLDQRPLAVTVGYRDVWVVTQGTRDNQVLRIDPATGKVTKRTHFSTSSPIDGLTAGLGGIWVVASSTATLYRIDPHSARVTGRRDLGQRAAHPWWCSAGSGSACPTRVVTRSSSTLGPSSPSCIWGAVRRGSRHGRDESIWGADTQDRERRAVEPSDLSTTAFIHLTDPPFYGGLCLTSIAAGASAVWVTVAESVNYGC